MGQWSGLWTENVKEIESGGPISDPGLFRSAKGTLDEFLLSSGGIAVL
jgi:hypothetical protein